MHRLDYEVVPGYSDYIFSSYRYHAYDQRCERNVQIYRVTDAMGNLWFYRTNIQRSPYQIRIDGDFHAVSLIIATLASDNQFLRARAKCLCASCDDHVHWDHPEPLSCDECSYSCLNPACTGFRICRFHFCTCGRAGRYNLRSGRR
jgi:hypothetical protein